MFDRSYFDVCPVCRLFSCCVNSPHNIYFQQCNLMSVNGHEAGSSEKNPAAGHNKQ